MQETGYEQRYLEQVRAVLAKIDNAQVHAAVSAIETARDHGKTIFVFGNGGSSSIASQMVGDLVKCCSIGREARFKAMCLSDSVPSVTSLANDEGYETVFVEQLKNFATQGDVVFGISGGDNSVNVLRAMEYANEIGGMTIALTSSEQGELRNIARLVLGVPATHMGHLEDAFFIMTHILCYSFIDA